MALNNLTMKLSEELEEAYDIINKTNLVIFKWTLSEDAPTDYVSENIKLFGYLPEDFYVGALKDYWEFVYHEDRGRVKTELYWAREHGKHNYKNQYRVNCKNGEIKWVEEWVIHERNEKDVLIHEKGIIRDITDSVIADAKIKYLTEHDTLTGLHNRLYFDRQLSRFENEEVPHLSIILGDINGLKMVNDAFGHKMGDQMLIEVSKVLMTIFNHEGDVIARLSGDEFAIITQTRNIPTKIDAIQSACQKLIQFPFVIDISLGYAIRKKTTQSLDSIFREADHQMYRNKLRRTKKIKMNMIESLKIQLETKSIETAMHSERMMMLVEKFGRFLNLNGTVIEELMLATSMHDIGMVSVDNCLLNKPGKLSQDEFKEIMKHPEIGYHLLVATPSLAGIAEYVLAHHENYDGSGYPQGLKGLEIPLLSRIIAIVDSYEAMTHDRTFRKALSHETALRDLMAQSGKKYDPNLVLAFINCLNDEKTEY